MPSAWVANRKETQRPLHGLAELGEPKRSHGAEEVTRAVHQQLKLGTALEVLFGEVDAACRREMQRLAP